MMSSPNMSRINFGRVGVMGAFWLIVSLALIATAVALSFW